MASGTILEGLLYGAVPGLAANVPGEHVLPQGARGGYDPDPLRTGALTNAQPIAIRSVAKSGQRAASFVDDFYNRIHISPRVIDYGAVSGGTTRSTILWNAYLSDSVLSEITVINDSAVTLGGATVPKTFRPLEYGSFTATVDDEGPPTIDTQYSFVFDDRPDTVILSLVGRRARLWPFAPNWRNAVEVNLEFRTDVMTSRAGREQRRSLRKTPRRRVEYTVTIDQTEMRAFHRAMTTWQSRPWLIADPVRRVVCPDGAPAGASQLIVDALPTWLSAGQLLVVGDSTVTAVEDVDTDLSIVTLDAALTETVAAGTVVRPALGGLLTGEVRARHPSSGATEFAIALAVTPGSEAEDVGAPGIDLLDGREILRNKPNWGDPVESGFTWAPEQIDFGFGRIETYNPLAFGAMIRRANFVAQTPNEATEINRFFCRQRGQRGEFLTPTWLNDLPPKFDLVEGTNFIRVEGTEVQESYSGDPTYQAIAVIMSDGRRIYRTITSIDLVADLHGADSVISCDGPWFSDLAVADIVMVCWLPVVRMASDQIIMEWLTQDVAQTSLAMRTLEYLPADDPIDSLDEAARWLLETTGEGAIDDFDQLDLIVNTLYPEITT